MSFKVDLLENFQTYIRDFKITLPKNMPMTQQVNGIGNSQQEEIEQADENSNENEAADDGNGENNNENEEDDDDDNDEFYDVDE